MATMKLSAEVRSPEKKGAARRLRGQGRIPGVLYGQGRDSMPVSFDHSEFEGLLRDRQGTVIIEVGMEGYEPQPTIVREIQRDPLSGRVLHIDLQHISLTERVQVEVPVHFVGQPYGVKTEGGVLEHHQRTVEIKCLPSEIPPRIEIDVSELRIGSSIAVDALPFDRDQIEVLTDDRTVIASVMPPRIVQPTAEEEAAAAAAAEEAAPGAEGAPATEQETAAEKKESS